MFSHTFRTLCAVVILGIGSSVSAQTVCKVYSLAEFGNDPQLTEWLGNTIPTVVEPQSWSETTDGAKPVLTCYPKTKMLVVYHTPAVQKAVAAFLDDVKKSLPAQEVATVVLRRETSVPILCELPCVNRLFTNVGYAETSVEPANLTADAPAKLCDSESQVIDEATLERPAHTVHIVLDGLDVEGIKFENFQFHYEGNGFVDSNIVELYRAQLQTAVFFAQQKEKSAEVLEAVQKDPLSALFEHLETTPKKTDAEPATKQSKKRGKVKK